jgi:hypothetical protein
MNKLEGMIFWFSSLIHHHFKNKFQQNIVVVQKGHHNYGFPNHSSGQSGVTKNPIQIFCCHHHLKHNPAAGTSARKNLK